MHLIKTTITGTQSIDRSYIYISKSDSIYFPKTGTSFNVIDAVNGNEYQVHLESSNRMPGLSLFFKSHSAINKGTDISIEIVKQNKIYKISFDNQYNVDISNNVVTNLDQVLENITELECGRGAKSGTLAEEYHSLIKSGTYFVPYASKDGLAFAPSKFVGYIGNKLNTHEIKTNHDDQITNAALNKIYGSQPYAHDYLERLYLEFCTHLGIKQSQERTDGDLCKFWVTPEALEILESAATKEIETDSQIPETVKQQLIKARVGQGKFRIQLLEHWGKCCLTGCTLHRVLRASHIKPWRDSSNDERLDVYNGLLLSPNMDSLFDKGLISFEITGEIIVSPQMTDNDIKLLGCDKKMKIELKPEHEKYLSYHRENLLIK